MNDANHHKNNPRSRPVRLRRRERDAGQIQTSTSGMHDQQRSMRVGKLHGGVRSSLSKHLHVYTLATNTPAHNAKPRHAAGLRSEASNTPGAAQRRGEESPWGALLPVTSSKT